MKSELQTLSRTQFDLPELNDLQTYVRTHQKSQTSNPRIEFDPTLADNWGTDGPPAFKNGEWGLKTQYWIK